LAVPGHFTLLVTVAICAERFLVDVLTRMLLMYRGHVIHCSPFRKMLVFFSGWGMTTPSKASPIQHSTLCSQRY